MSSCITHTHDVYTHAHTHTYTHTRTNTHAPRTELESNVSLFAIDSPAPPFSPLSPLGPCRARFALPPPLAGSSVVLKSGGLPPPPPPPPPPRRRWRSAERDLCKHSCAPHLPSHHPSRRTPSHRRLTISAAAIEAGAVAAAPWTWPRLAQNLWVTAAAAAPPGHESAGA